MTLGNEREQRHRLLFLLFLPDLKASTSAGWTGSNLMKRALRERRSTLAPLDKSAAKLSFSVLFSRVMVHKSPS